MTVGLVALHGFLGQAADWDPLAAQLPGVTVRALDLWRILGNRDVRDWPTAVAAVDAALREALAQSFDAPPRRSKAPAAAVAQGAVFVAGYSLGARLVLGSSWLSSGEAPVRGCCLVSCNPGLPDDDEAARGERRASDEEWARRIRDEPERMFWRAWDAQPVFAGSLPPAGVRGALPAPRVLLSRAMIACSLAGQPDLRARLRAWPTPLLWVTGARDTKFSAIARELGEAGVPGRFESCETAGHRVPWDDERWFAGLLRGWMSQVMENER